MEAMSDSALNLTPLRAFWVGEGEIYAAYDATGALALANREYGQAFFSLDDVRIARRLPSKARPIQRQAPG